MKIIERVGPDIKLVMQELSDHAASQMQAQPLPKKDFIREV